jgi:phosphoribosylglycinamide formyltransferase-1
VKRVAVLVSGSGSNLQAMIDARTRGELSANLAVVLSNRPGVKALERAANAGIEALVIDHKAFANRAAFDEAMTAALVERGIELVVLAGFMRLLSPAFVTHWRGRLVNIHPSLLPAFPGAHAIKDAVEAKATKTGVTIHFVDEGTDTGPIIAQAEVPVLPDDTEDSLASRIHVEEHKLYPRVVEALVRGEVKLEGRSVIGSVGAVAK